MPTDLICAGLRDVDNAGGQLAAQVLDESHGEVLGLVGDVHVTHAAGHGQQQCVVLLVLCGDEDKHRPWSATVGVKTNTDLGQPQWE